MKTSKLNRLWMIIVPITLLVATSGCVTRRYVSKQVDPVNHRVSDLETKTNQRMAAMSAKEQADISRVDERITTTDNKLAEVSSTAQQANSAAAQANQMAQANQTDIQVHTDAIKSGADKIAEFGFFARNAWNYELIEKGDVTFGFNKSTLDNQAKIALDQIIQKAKAMPRAVVELNGFTDKVGSHEYNLVLSRRRAEAVARYLVRNDVPLRSVNVIGLGEENPPPSLTADLKAVDPSASRQETRRLARRVFVRVYAPVTGAGEAARSQE
jgi:outer membrane protein OmpA-like peptidoglycan-associated protein